MIESRTAWVAGIIEGEGHIARRGRSTRLEVTMGDKDVIERVHEWTGIGTVRGPIEREGGTMPYWCWSAGSIECMELLKDLLPWLGQRRSAKAREGIEAWSQPGITRASDTHCMHGHLLSPENVRSTYNGKGRICRVCANDASRRYREANKEKVRQSSLESYHRNRLNPQPRTV